MQQLLRKPLNKDEVKTTSRRDEDNLLVRNLENFLKKSRQSWEVFAGGELPQQRLIKDD